MSKPDDEKEIKTLEHLRAKANHIIVDVRYMIQEKIIRVQLDLTTSNHEHVVKNGSSSLLGEVLERD